MGDASVHDRSPEKGGAQAELRVKSDVPFYIGLGLLAGTYVLLIVAMLIAEASYTTPDHILKALANEDIRYSIRLSLYSCTVTTILSLWVAVPIGYLMSRHRFRGKVFVDAVLDIPIVLPPLVIGLCLLILFQTGVGRGLEGAYVSAGEWVCEQLSRLTGRTFLPPAGITYQIPAVILAQFMVAAAFAVRTMRVAFDQIDARFEDVALTLGCSRGQAFWRVVFPQCRRGMLAAGTLAWARSLGEFGPILVFAGATRGKTEVLSTTVFLELTVGNLEGAVAASLIMVTAAIVVLVIARVFGLKRMAL
ncbi:MAG: ABC transporter permease [Planctomycetaceae bacterium]